MNIFFKILHHAGVWISWRGRSVPWRTCVARRDPAHMHAHTWGGGTRTVCLTPATEPGRPTACTIPPPQAAEPPMLTV